MCSYIVLFVFFLLSCNSDKGITVFNPNPEAEISSHLDGDEVLEGYVTTFMGNVSDANHSADQLTATWKSGLDILCAPTVANLDGTSVCEAVLTPDDRQITLEVKDADNAPGQDTISISVVPSAKPTADIITPESGGVYYSDQMITFEGLLADEEDDADLLVAFWQSSRDGELTEVDAIPQSDGSILGYGYLTEGEHAIELTVEDITGKTDRVSVVIDVGPPNSAPLCSITEPVDGSAGPQGNTVSFLATVSDVDVSSDMLDVVWSSDKDGDIGTSVPNSAGGVSFSYADLSVNTHNISMTVTDEVGATCTVTTNYTVGTPPSITLDAPLDGSVHTEGEMIDFSATVFDGQDIPTDVALEWSANGVLISTQAALSTGVATFSDSSLGYGTYNLIVTATDTDGLTNSDQINFTVNGVPSVPDVSISPEPAYTTSDLTANILVDSVDPEGEIVNYTFEWRQNNVVSPTYTTASVPASATSKDDTWTVYVTPNDGITQGAVGTASIHIGNTAPTLSSLAIAPTGNVYNDMTLTCSAVVTDPDETLTPTYSWSLGSTSVGSNSTLNLLAVGAVPGDIVTCSVSVVDGDGESATNSINTAVENRAPVVDSISLAPNLVYTDDTIIATALLSDDDMQSITEEYAWHVLDAATGLDSVVQSGTSNTLDGTLHFDRDDEVYVVVTPNDGITDGASVTSSGVIISNTPPTAPSVSVSPNPAIYGQNNLICSVVSPSSDDDGDSIVYTYIWTDESGTMQQTTALVTDTSDTLDASVTSIGEWTCSVTPSDGTDAGPSASAIATVESACPGQVAFIASQVQADSYIPCTELTTIIAYQTTGVVSINLPNLVTVHDEVNIFENVDLVELSLPNLETVGEYVYIKSHDVLESVDLDALQSVEEHLAISENDVLDSLVLDTDLIYVGTFSLFIDNPLLCVPDLDWASISQDNHHDMGNLDCTDIDGDGISASHDCDDNDPTVSTEGSGGSEMCPAESCKTILDDGYSTGDGMYWIDPSGSDAVDVYCDMTTDGGGWSILVENLLFPSNNIYSASEYASFCAGHGMTFAGREVENAVSWLVQKRMLWNTNHPIKQNGWPSAWVVNNQYGGSLAMPMYRTSAGLVNVYDGTEVSLPPSLIGDQCDPGGNEDFCGYWYSEGWNDPDLSVYPDPEDWGSQHNHADMYISCMFR